MPPTEMQNARRFPNQSRGCIRWPVRAVTTLGKAMVDPSTPPATKVRAADSILDHTAKAIELEDLEARLADLERSAEIWKTR